MAGIDGWVNDLKSNQSTLGTLRIPDEPTPNYQPNNKQQHHHQHLDPLHHPQSSLAPLLRQSCRTTARSRASRRRRGSARRRPRRRGWSGRGRRGATHGGCTTTKCRRGDRAGPSTTTTSTHACSVSKAGGRIGHLKKGRNRWTNP